MLDMTTALFLTQHVAVPVHSSSELSYTWWFPESSDFRKSKLGNVQEHNLPFYKTAMDNWSYSFIINATLQLMYILTHTWLLCCC